MKIKKDNITIYQMEKSSIEYKKSHTVQVFGLTDNEPPKWFSDFINNDFKKLLDRIDNLVAKNNLKE